jgi:hypothetical protein
VGARAGRGPAWAPGGPGAEAPGRGRAWAPGGPGAPASWPRSGHDGAMPAAETPSELDPERRGLAAPRPSGGQDPNPDATAHSERRYLWLLVLMIALIVGITTLVGIVGMIVVAFGGST